MTKFQCLFDYIVSQILMGVIIADNYKIFYFLIISIKLTSNYWPELLMILSCTTNKTDNIMKLLY